MYLRQTNPDTFQQVLSQRVSAYFRDNRLSRFANRYAYIKMLIIGMLWTITLALIYTTNTSFVGYLGLYLLHGCMALLVVYNIGHDAVHQAISPKKWVNTVLSYSFNVLGGNSYSWYLKHNIGHHTYTNIHGKDIDIETTPLFRISPHTPLKQYYRFQHLYIIPLYCFLSLVLIFVFDFLVMGKIKPTGSKKHAFREWVILVCTKVFYIGYIIILPVYILPIMWCEVLLCFLAMHALTGLFISLVLLPSHFVPHAAYFEQSHEIGRLNSWAAHQLLTTIDIAPDSKWANVLLGGLNTNIIHHIFPSIHHVHFVELTAILKQTATEYQMPYTAFPVTGALKAHFGYIKKMGSEKSPYSSGI